MAELDAVVSEADWERGCLPAVTMQRLTEVFHRRGFATIGNVIPHDVVDALKPRMDFDAAHQQVIRKFEERGVNGGAGGHLQMGIPRCAPYVSKELASNPFMEQIAYSLLDGKCRLSFFNGNTNMCAAHPRPPAGRGAHPRVLPTVQDRRHSICTRTAAGTARRRGRPRRRVKSGR